LRNVLGRGVFTVHPVSSGQIDIHGRIREVLAETGGSDHGGSHGALSETECLHALQRRGIIEDVMKDIRFTQVQD